MALATEDNQHLCSESVRNNGLLSIDHKDDNDPTTSETSIEREPHETISDHYKRDKWTDEITTFLLDKQEQYLEQVGSKKRFKAKKDMWEQISNDLRQHFGTSYTYQQVENRYKTVMKRRKRSAMKEANKSDVEVINIGSIDDSSEFEVTSNDDSLSCNSALKKRKIEKDYYEMLVEIFKQQEENRDRRHDEMMGLLKQLFGKD